MAPNLSTLQIMGFQHVSHDMKQRALVLQGRGYNNDQISNILRISVWSIQRWLHNFDTYSSVQAPRSIYQGHPSPTSPSVRSISPWPVPMPLDSWNPKDRVNVIVRYTRTCIACREQPPHHHPSWKIHLRADQWVQNRQKAPLLVALQLPLKFHWHKVYGGFFILIVGF